MSLTLYYAPGACSFVPHVALEMIHAATGAEVAFRHVKIHKGEQNAPEFRALNPDGQVPLLLVDDKPLTQLIAICEYLDTRYPEAGLLPRDPWARAQALSALAWMNNTAHPAFSHVFMPYRYTDDPDAQARIKAAGIKEFEGHLQRIQGWLECAHPWLFGERASVADVYALTLLRWGGMAGIDPASLPAYRAFSTRLALEPAVAAAIAREGIPLELYKPPKP
jgi:glutathione S-transferase